MHSLVRSSILAACLLLVIVSAIIAETPAIIRIQFRLEDASSNPVPDGMHSLTLTGWNDSTGGSLLWMENKIVQTKDGLSDLMLDGAGPAGILAHSGQQYIQVQVSGQAPMTPRIRLASVPSALLTTRMDGDVVTQPGAMVVRPPGDPDFDLLRITAVDSTASISMGGDPDFDLLRIAAGISGTSLVMQGDPDFDLLRISGVDSTGTVAIGDPDFDLLRMTANPSGSSLAMGGDPDFDLLRMTANDTAASLAMTGDPDFDLLRISTGSTVARIAIKDPGVKVMEMSNDLDGDGVAGPMGFAINDQGIERVHVSSGGGAASVRLNGLPPGSPVQGGIIEIDADSGGGTIAIKDPGVKGVQMSSDLDGDGVAGPFGLAVNEEGTHNITIAIDSTGGSIAIGEEGVQIMRLQSGGGGGGGGHGGGSIAVNEDGTHNISISADSTGGSFAIGEEGVQRILMDNTGGGGRCNFYENWPCGPGNVEIGSSGLVFRCLAGGGSTGNTTVFIDRDGNMGLDGNLSVGGNICAVGTIGACSDARYKTDIATLEGALARIEQIRGVNFNWRTDEFPDKHFRTDRDLGFIAQELKEVVPQVVTLGQDGYYSVDYGRITPLLVEAVKELDAKAAKIDELEMRLASMDKVHREEMATLAAQLARLERDISKLASGTGGPEAGTTVASAP